MENQNLPNLDKAAKDEIRRITNNYNARVRRLEKTGKLYHLPSRQSIRQLWKMNQEQLEMKLEDMKAFSAKLAREKFRYPGGDYITGYENLILKRRMAKALQIYEDRLKRYNSMTPRVYGKAQDGTNYESPDLYSASLESNIKALRRLSEDKVDASFARRRLKQILHTVYDTEADERYRKDAIGVLDYYAMFADEETSKRYEILRERFMKMDPYAFFLMFQNERMAEYFFEYWSPKNLDQESINIKAEQFSNFISSFEDITKQYENISEAELKTSKWAQQQRPDKKVGRNPKLSSGNESK